MKNWLFVMMAAFLAASVVAQEEADIEETAEKPAVAGKGASVKTAIATFYALPLCRHIEGVAEVKQPNAEWVLAEEGKYYPVGTSYRTKKGQKLSLAFGAEAEVVIADDAEFGTRVGTIGGKSRTIIPAYGTIEIFLPDNLAEGAVSIATPGFIVKNPAGNSRISYQVLGDGDQAEIRCVTGSLAIEGRHFEIPGMHAADEIDIRTSHDYLVTALYGKSGVYAINIDQGVKSKKEIGEDGVPKDVVGKDTLEWKMSPKMSFRIDRAVPTIGERMSVHTMGFDAAGELQSERFFCEGRAEINSGEIIAKKAAEDDSEKHAEAAETTEDTEDDSAEDVNEN